MEMMDLRNALILLANNVGCDVCESYLQVMHSLIRGIPYPRSALYSEFGHKTIMRYLNNNLLTFYTELGEIANLQHINDYYFDVIIDLLIERFSWLHAGHETFYEICARIGLLGIYALLEGRLTRSKIKEAIRKFALRAYSFYYLETFYDEARTEAQCILNTLFKLVGQNIANYVTTVERETSFPEREFPAEIMTYINDNFGRTLESLRSVPQYETMDLEKFDDLVRILLQNCLERRIGLPADISLRFLVLAVSVGFISLYCIERGFNAGVQRGFDHIIKLLVLENRYSLISRLTVED